MKGPPFLSTYFLIFFWLLTLIAIWVIYCGLIDSCRSEGVKSNIPLFMILLPIFRYRVTHRFSWMKFNRMFWMKRNLNLIAKSAIIPNAAFHLHFSSIFQGERMYTAFWKVLGYEPWDSIFPLGSKDTISFSQEVCTF